MVIGFYANLAFLVNKSNTVYYMYLVFYCLYISYDITINGLPLLSEYGLTYISIHVTYLDNYYSGSLGELHTAGGPAPGGGSTPGGGSNPGGGPNPPQDPNSLAVLQANELPREDSNNSLLSSVSYTTDDLNQSAGADLQNMENIMKDKSLSEEKRTDEVMNRFSKLHNDLINAKREIANLKK